MTYMMLTILIVGAMSYPNISTILKASQTDPYRDWTIVNDTVMGGRSWSKVETGKDSTVVFRGLVSLENNGGFASTRIRPEHLDLSSFEGMVLKIKGDGKRYQLRLRTDDAYDGIAYRAIFKTLESKWMTVQIPFTDFLPSFRGRIMGHAPLLDPGRVRQIAFMIAAKQPGEFRLEIDSILVYGSTR